MQPQATPARDIVPVRSARHANVSYQVNIALGTCQCPGFTFNKKCRHIEEARAKAGRCGACHCCKTNNPLGCARINHDLGALIAIDRFEAGAAG